MAQITSANAANAILKLIAADALPALVGNLVMGRLVNRDFEPALASTGDTINIPLPPVLTANNIAEGGSVNTQNPSLGNAQIVLNTHAEATFAIPDVTKTLVYPNLLTTYMQPAVIAIAESVEKSLLNLYTQFTSNTAVGGATPVDEARIDSAETALFNAKIPPGMPRFLAVNGATYGGLRQISRFTDYTGVGPSGQPSAQITGDLPGGGPMGADGKLKDLLVFRSQYVPTVGGTTYNLAFGRDAMGLVIRRLPMPMPGTGAVAEYAEMGDFGMRVVMSYQPSTLAQQFTVDILYGVGVLRNQFGVQVQTNQ